MGLNSAWLGWRCLRRFRMYQVKSSKSFILGRASVPATELPEYSATIGTFNAPESSPGPRCAHRRCAQHSLCLNGWCWPCRAAGRVLAARVFSSNFPFHQTLRNEIHCASRRARNRAEERGPKARSDVGSGLSKLPASTSFNNSGIKTLRGPKGRASGPKVRGPKARVPLGPGSVRPKVQAA